MRRVGEVHRRQWRWWWGGLGGVDGGYFGAGAPQVCFQVVQPRHSGYTSYRAVAGVVCTVCGDFTCFGGVAFCAEECPGWRGNFSLADAWAKVFSRAPAHTAMLCRFSSGCEKRLHGAGVAQLVAQRTCNASVASSSLVSSSAFPWRGRLLPGELLLFSLVW